jgi:hypothetical protein
MLFNFNLVLLLADISSSGFWTLSKPFILELKTDEKNHKFILSFKINGLDNVQNPEDKIPTNKKTKLYVTSIEF